jgi:hypothetical protein
VLVEIFADFLGFVDTGGLILFISDLRSRGHRVIPINARLVGVNARSIFVGLKRSTLLTDQFFKAELVLSVVTTDQAGGSVV